MTSILGAASTVMAPYPANNMTVVVSEVTTDAKGHGTPTWSAAQNGNAHPVGQAVTLPADLQIPSISLLWGEVTYPYTPSLGYIATGTLSLYESEYFYPRLSSCVSFGGRFACSAALHMLVDDFQRRPRKPPCRNHRVRD
jgi:hypothetical protein